jgi:hypothetical protein
MTGVEMIAKERARQVVEEGRTAEHDDDHWHSELALAAASYAMPLADRQMTTGGLCPKWWPWEWRSWKPTPDDRVRELVKAGALIAAEIDRLQRLTR